MVTSCNNCGPGPTKPTGDSQDTRQFDASSGSQARVLSRVVSLASAVVRLTYTFSEGAVEGLFNMCHHMYDLMPIASRQQDEPFLQDLTGKVAIVTGGNAGIGFATAQQLARRGAHVVLACRDKGRAEAAVQAIARTPSLHSIGKATTANGSANGGACRTATPTSSSSSAAAASASCTPPSPPPSSLRVESMELDLGRLSSVRRFAEEWRRRGLPLHLLVCNAGVMAPLQRTTTADGLEVQFQVNFLSHWLLTHLLLDQERERRRKAAAAAPVAEANHGWAAGSGSGGAKAPASGSGVASVSGDCALPDGSTRVVVVSSVVHRAGLLQWTDKLSERSYEPYISYGLSKLATVIFAKELQRRFDRHPEYGLHDTAVAIHPGIVRTQLANGFFRSYGLSWATGTPLEPLQRLWHTIWDTAGQSLLASTETAAHRMLAACLGRSEQLAGRYLALGRVYPADKASDDPAMAAELWDTATRLTSYSPPPSLA